VLHDREPKPDGSTMQDDTSATHEQPSVAVPRKLEPWAESYSWARNVPRFMETRGSLPHSQQRPIFPYPEPHKSSPSRVLKIILILSYHLRLDVPRRVLPSSFHCMHPYVPHAPPISFFLIFSPK
jgi:hypothetical protein